MSWLKHVYRKAPFTVTGNLKSNLVRIVQKIKESYIKGEDRNPFRIYDMIRATIAVPAPHQIAEAFEMLKNV